MKVLQAKQHTKSRQILTDGGELEIAEFPIIWDKDGWMVFEDNSCEECPTTYLLQKGQNETTIICQTVEQIRVYIPEFKFPKDKPSAKEE
jgi:hypothetical protein